MNKEEELRRDADDLKRMQQEHISELDTNLLASSFDDLDEEHVAWLKKKSPKITGSISRTLWSLRTTCYDDPTKDHSGPATCQVLQHATDLIRNRCAKMCKLVLQNNIPVGLADLGLLATVGPRTIHVYDKLYVVLLSTDSGEIRDSNKIMLMRKMHEFDSYSESFQTAFSRIYSSETSVIQTLQSNHPIIHVQLNQPIDYLDPRPEYIRVIIKWLTKSSISITHTVSPDTQRSLLSARRCEGLDGYS
ncbi:unnamed protein product [Rotaria magnacalcarata]|uniref:Uncharacterized protein n=1 Tax=Rotaria magnacalcarata TaxID=392030 RepID=A0A8S2N0C6_9BILA|nr:unnamed protein product [Rotaria magnacalcarata]CAF4054439.1 unnamed protein product [Rotaria magnacalcarata]CAF4068205.1 unnamed protein product [Rotaria magnacalcarata]